MEVITMKVWILATPTMKFHEFQQGVTKVYATLELASEDLTAVAMQLPDGKLLGYAVVEVELDW